MSGLRRGAGAAAGSSQVCRISSSTIVSRAWIPALPVLPGGATSQEYVAAARNFSVQARVENEEIDDFSVLAKMVEPEFDVLQAVVKWTEKGHVLSSETLARLATWMVEKRRFVQALKLLTGARESKLAEVSGQLLALELDLLSRQYKCSRVEAIYDAFPEELRTADVNRALLSSFIRDNRVEKAEKFLEKGKVLDTEGWNVVLDMYLARDKHRKLFKTLTRMKESGVEPDAKTYRILLVCKDAAGGFEGIEADARKRLEEIDIGSAQAGVLEEMLEVYGHLREMEAVDRIWSALKESHQVAKACYVTAMKAFGMAGDVSLAEKVLQELLAITTSFPNRKHNPYAAMVDVYARAGLMHEAEKLLKDKADEELKDSFWCYESLVAGYLLKGDAKNALGKFKGGLAAVKKGPTRLEYKSVMGLLAALALRRDVDEAEKVMGHYSSLFGEAPVYNQLLKVYIAAGKTPKEFKERMLERFVEPDEETEKLLQNVVAEV
ncbi:pentatricopeptide repeat-containing protein At2g20710, mitochondrial-like [Selaginella moellendorffii]|uniref:pentatricopeptide repeat-containing protein At2g20710, mitochondrial-like n=1 Tax=Selaginella moellendorffii TaxID=88036 RepID=UPI000D1CF565|nr:pentatricopeptide repeat-containing protein At2g20710, mitochondrial-like [Selaginella moellendorffii]|eukprot:XP_024526538.1 pentatricopeptide repeat-containing protein At2g20710, mitochondrial-like [Selaginella moellendorffii]